MRTAALCAWLLILGSWAVAGTENRLPQGGGVIYPAWTAQYWDNAKLEGAPRWEQSQIRVRFDWEDWRPVIGSLGEQIRDFPTDNFSARFTARLIARFDETYTFKLVSDEGARLSVRPEGAKDWTVLIDAWAPHPRRADTATTALKPGARYDVQLDYYDLTDDAVCQLSWSSPSTPEEVVDYVSGSTIREHAPDMWADMNAFSGTSRDGAFPANAAKCGDFEVDENGWPKGDFRYTLQQGYRSYAGRHRISFIGQAEVRMPGIFTAGGQTFTNVLPKGAGYEPQANRTTAFLDVTDGSRTLGVEMVKTQRAPGSAEGSGVTEFHVMKPVKAGGREAHHVGEMACGEAREAFLPFLCFRVQRTGLNDIVKWAERTRPAYARINGQYWRADLAYEKLVAEANELGRDLYLCFGGSIDYEFMDKLALLTRYGSDGESPYAGPTKNPKYPPLNSNLRLYLEHGNEMGWSAIQPGAWKKDYDAIHKAKREPEWSAVNFDGLVADDPFRGLMRYHAYRTVRMSQAMRKAWGDAAMGETVRVCLFGQYERDFQNTMPQYIDDYFNNGTGPHVKDPHPVSYYLWGAGPAVYYGTVNLWAESDTAWLKDRSFEGYDIKPGEAALAPAGGAWVFDGGAGVVDVRYPRHEAVAGAQAGDVAALGGDTVVGFQFAVGAVDLYVYELGRQVPEGAKGTARVALLNADGSPLGRADVAVEMKGAKPGTTAYAPLRYTGWMTSDSFRVGLYRLGAGKRYLLVSSEGKGAKLPSAPAAITPGPGLTIEGGVRVAGGLDKKTALKGRVATVGDAGVGFGHVNFRYTSQILAPAEGMAVVPPDPAVDPSIAKGGLGKSNIPQEVRTGTRMAFIAGKGALSQSFTIADAGEYALILSGACGQTGDNRLTIALGKDVVWEKELLQGARKPKFGVFNYGTRYTHLEPGTYTLRIEGTNPDPAAVTYIDGVHLGNMLDYFGGTNAANFLGAGQATGQTDSKFAVVSKLTTAMAQNWGLVPFAYEGGFNAGGDWNGGNVLYAFQTKWDHPLSTVADNNWARFWHQHGGFNAMYYYPAFDDIVEAENRRPWMAARDRAMGWEMEPTEGLRVPGALTCEEPHCQGQPGSRWDGWSHPYQKNGFSKGTKLEKGQWKAWIVAVTEARPYTFSAATTSGGKATLSVGDAARVAQGVSGEALNGSLFLARGLHAVKLRCDDGAFDVNRIELK